MFLPPEISVKYLDLAGSLLKGKTAFDLVLIHPHLIWPESR